MCSGFIQCRRAGPVNLGVGPLPPTAVQFGSQLTMTAGYFLVAALSLGTLLLPHPGRSGEAAVRPPCRAMEVDPRFTVAPPASSISLEITVIEATAERSNWHARLKLRNVGTRTIRMYVIDVVATYENLGQTYSSIGGDAVSLAPGEAMEDEASDGFENDLLCGKPVGDLEGVVFEARSCSYRRRR